MKTFLDDKYGPINHAWMELGAMGIMIASVGFGKRWKRETWQERGNAVEIRRLAIVQTGKVLAAFYGLFVAILVPFMLLVALAGGRMRHRWC